MKASREFLQEWVVQALQDLGGSATLVDVCRWVWDHHRGDLEEAGDLFYTWQYDIRWAATRLRTQQRLRPAPDSPRGTWELVR